MYRPPVLLIKSAAPARLLPLHNARDKKDLTRVSVVAQSLCATTTYISPTSTHSLLHCCDSSPSQRLALAQWRGYSHSSLTQQRTITASSPWHDARHGCSSDADGHRACSSQAPFPSPPHFCLFFTTFFSATPPLQLPLHLCPICNGQTHSAPRQRTAARHHH